MRNAPYPHQQTVTHAPTLAFAAALVVLLLSARSLADPGSEMAAKETVEKAVSEYNLGHFAAASTLFEKAYRLDPAPILLFNIGQCQRRLGDNDRALFFYRRYLDVAPATASQRGEVEKRVAELEGTIREQGELKNRPPPGVATASPVAVSAGPGGGTAGDQATDKPPVSEPSPRQPNAQPAQEGDAAAAPAQGDEASTRTVLTWTALGLSVGALVFGVVEHIDWQHNVNLFQSMPTVCGTGFKDKGGAICMKYFDDGEHAKKLALAGYGLAVGLALTTTILYFTAPGRDPDKQKIACAPAIMTNGFSCAARF